LWTLARIYSNARCPALNVSFEDAGLCCVRRQTNPVLNAVAGNNKTLRSLMQLLQSFTKLDGTKPRSEF
jgi:hypothetical protein